MNILIADDHEVVRRGLKAILFDEFPKIKIGETSAGRETLEAVRRQAWDAVLLDINMPGRSGLEVLEEIKQLRPRTPVLIISAFPEQEYALRAFKLGAAGYVSKQSASDELIAALRKTLAGGRYVTPALAERMAETMAGEVATAPHELLSNREMEVLRLIAMGKTIKEIASELALSEKTIGTYRARLSEKMGLSTNVELTRYALQHHLVD
ncbi:MAG: response regulator transcription factor [Verrucomicrobia subdivision 3 bacterium]|nr:response regulator transcription factor [Limisphaerales bacterium]